MSEPVESLNAWERVSERHPPLVFEKAIWTCVCQRG